MLNASEQVLTAETEKIITNTCQIRFFGIYF